MQHTLQDEKKKISATMQIIIFEERKLRINQKISWLGLSIVHLVTAQGCTLEVSVCQKQLEKRASFFKKVCS